MGNAGEVQARAGARGADGSGAHREWDKVTLRKKFALL